MIQPFPKKLTDDRVRLEPLSNDHADELREVAKDGELWNLFFTSVPHPDAVDAYIETALAGQAAGHMLPWAVRELASDRVIGSTRFHDIVPRIDRVEIGYTWYAASFQRTHINSSCKLLLMKHAFDELGCEVVGLRTDGMNFRSQRAIEALGANRDGVIRHFAQRRDGSPRDNVMYSILKNEWPSVRKHLEARIWRHDQSKTG